MQFLSVSKDMTMQNLRKIVGSRNVSEVLQLNQLSITPNIGRAVSDLYDTVIATIESPTTTQKLSILNSVSVDADVFESVSLLDNDEWKYMATIDALPNTLRIPDTLILPNRADILGGTNTSIRKPIYDKAVAYISRGESVDPIIYNTYNSARSAVPSGSQPSSVGVMQWFNIPWGQVTMHSSISGESVDFPVYPEEYDDEYTATYDQMPDMLYQYEPWFVYKNSGPRTISLTFKMHRDMWSGDHRDGKCNDLIRFCEAQCYPSYSGAAVNTAIATLYIAGQTYIRGIITSVKPTYSGPIGYDSFPLYVELQISFSEVAFAPLNYHSVRNKGN